MLIQERLNDSTTQRLQTFFTVTLATINGFEPSPTIAVAVSGGADSMALLLLAHQWVSQTSGRVIALTVDHGLRTESAQEARQVEEWCNGLGIEHHIIGIRDSGFGIQGSGIQQQAREARYALLTDWCRRNGVHHLMTAHHRDDQAETLFFRLARGSDIDGLACMPMLSHMHGVRLLRPLLAVPKSSLEDFLKQCGQKWIEDPSNRKPEYTRNRIRDLMQQTGDADAISQRAYDLTAAFGEIRHRLETHLAHHLAQCVELFPEGYAAIDHVYFRTLAPEYAIRTLSKLALALNGESYAPRTAKLERLYEEIMSGRITRRTFAGLLFVYQKKTQRLLAGRELNAIKQSTPLPDNVPALWDNRFRVSCSGRRRPAETIEVRALGPAGLGIIRNVRPQLLTKKQASSAILYTLPAFWNLEELVAVPHMDYMNADYNHLQCSADFHPVKPLAAPAFFSQSKNTTYQGM